MMITVVNVFICRARRGSEGFLAVPEGEIAHLREKRESVAPGTFTHPKVCFRNSFQKPFDSSGPLNTAKGEKIRQE